MKQILIMIAAAAAFVFTVSVQAATLKSGGTVEGARITLGDLFDGIGDLAGTAVAAAPAPGRQAVYDAPSLTRLARRFGIDWQATSQADRIALTRASTVLRAEQAQIAVAAALADRAVEGRIEVELDNRLLEVHLPAEAAPTAVVESLTYDAALGRFSGSLVAPAEPGTAQLRIPVSGRATAVVDVPVPNRRLRAGEVIGPGDLTWIEMRLARGTEDVIRSEADLVGLSAKRSLAANAPVRARDLRQPFLVAKGSLVTIVLESPNMLLTAQGRALQDGAQGDVVRIVNTASNRTIEATVTAAGQVTVTRPGAAAQF